MGTLADSLDLALDGDMQAHAPHVTGVVARMLSRNAYLSAKDIRELLIQTARRPRGEKPRWDPRRGHGTVDAAAAIRRVEELMGTPASDDS